MGVFQCEGLVLGLTFLIVLIACTEAKKLDYRIPLDWKAPEKIQRALPYYVSGRDKDGRVVVVLECGNWDISWIGRATGKDLEDMNNHMYKIVQIAHNPGLPFNETVGTKNKAVVDEDNENPGMALIIDAINFPISKVTARFIQWGITQARLAPKVYEEVDYMYFVNTPAAVHTIINFVRPALGALFSKVEVFGTNKERWLPRLHEKIARSQLPEWYGGPSKDFKPVKFYG